MPLLEEQERLVAELEGYRQIIESARQILTNYKPILRINPEWPTMELGEIADVQLGKMLDKAKHRSGRLLPYLANANVRWGSFQTDDLRQMFFEDDEIERFQVCVGDVLVCEGGEPGRAAVWNDEQANVQYQKALHRVRFKIPFEPQLLVFILQGMAAQGQLLRRLSGTTIKHLTREGIIGLRVPVPPVADQRRIVSELEAERRLVQANRELAARFEQKLQSCLAEIWGETPAEQVVTTGEENDEHAIGKELQSRAD